MGLHGSLIRFLQERQRKARLRRRGPLGDFFRAGGDGLLHDVPVASGDTVVDAGGFEGDWSAAMQVRFGCRCELYEPVPSFAEHCRRRFQANGRVTVRQEALGGSDREASFSVESLASSEFAPGSSSTIRAAVTDVHAVVDRLAARFGDVACVKLNIEGGEYEVLERLLDSAAVARCRSLLIQFHRQPEGWRDRQERIIDRLAGTHEPVWRFPMVWELWKLRTARA